MQEDVKAGREAAQEVTQQLPILRDDGVDGYVERIGQRLAEAISQRVSSSAVPLHVRCRQCQRPECVRAPWRSDVHQPRDAEAAKNEGEVAGVLAHEISHVALRHGTAQAGKATPYQVGSVLGQIAGAIIGGVAGQAISLGSQFIPARSF